MQISQFCCKGGSGPCQLHLEGPRTGWAQGVCVEIHLSVFLSRFLIKFNLISLLPAALSVGWESSVPLHSLYCSLAPL